MCIVVLDTDLFPDRQTVESAFRGLEADHEVRHIDVATRELDDHGWDRILTEILDAERVIAI